MRSGVVGWGGPLHAPKVHRGNAGPCVRHLTLRVLLYHFHLAIRRQRKKEKLEIPPSESDWCAVMKCCLASEMLNLLFRSMCTSSCEVAR
ncbi:hypothetical protein NPIL_328771 [Nephila pilipes]|uniref:Uncharacterized protein n=1 Tax=Nephila pilipes TaxID=299642 RepID=A0A8X6PKY4_NEPPI|nr:hypothetical protein NPIL_328771 [Nephila pilipes]